MTPPSVAGVLLDFAGTLLYPGPRQAWLSAGLEAAGMPVPAGGLDDAAARAEETGGRPGGPEPRPVPSSLAAAWAGRDLTQAAHRGVYEALLARELADAALVTALYERGISAADWVPYADAATVLRGLRERGIGVAVVSNVGFDLAAIFAGNGLLDDVDVVVESWREGVVKPDPALFRVACERLGVAPEAALMVGDNPVADAGGVALGIRTLLLPVTPAGSVHGLAAALAVVDASR